MGTVGRARPQLGRGVDRRSHARLRRSPSRGRSGPVAVAWLDDGHTPPRVAFALPRRLGTAVIRNRIRRRCRAALGHVDLTSGTYLVTAHAAAASVPFPALVDHLGAATTAASTGTVPSR